MSQPTTNNLGDNQDSAQRNGRPRQPLRNQCRRCHADLSLVVATHRRFAFIREQLTQTTKGSPQHKRFKKEFQMLIGAASTKNTD